MFIGGFCFAFAPSLAMFITAPRQFLHGVIDYHLITLKFQGLPNKETIDIFNKLSFFVTEILSPIRNLLLSAAFLFFVFFKVIIKAGARIQDAFEVFFTASAAIFLFVFSFLSTPSWPQYFYAPIPFFILGIVYSVAFLLRKGEKTRIALAIFIALWAGSVFIEIPEYISALPPQPKLYQTTFAHGLGVKIAEKVRSGKVLTLAPIFPLEGRVDIYKEFATGPFMWRISDLVDKHDREALKVISADELEDYLDRERPAAILVGFQKDLERPFILYAKKRGFKKQNIPKYELWVWPSTAF